MDLSAQSNQHNAMQGKSTLSSDNSIQEKGVEDDFHGVGANDVAATFLHGLDASVTSAPVTDEESRKLLTKIDWALIPLLSGTVILAAVDKVIISNAAIYGMTADTHLVGQQYSWVGSIFYFGYLIAEFPAAYLVQRLPVAKLLVGCVTAWGVLMMCIAATQNFAGLATIRFLFGMAEVPAFIIASIITTMWWTTSEQPIRIAFWFNQGSSIFAGIISYGIGHTNTSIAPWRLLFLVLGGFSFIWAFVLWYFLPDSPVSLRFLSDRDKYVCINRIRQNNTGLEDKRVKWYQVRECLFDIKTWLLALFALAQNIPNGGLVTFSSLIVSGLGYSKLATTLLGIPTGIIATVWQLIWSFTLARYPHHRCATIASINIVPLICAVLMWQLPRSNKHGLLAAYYCFYSYWAPYVLSTSLPMANTSGHSKKLTMNAVFFISYCCGNIIGPQLFRTTDAPDYSKGYIGLLICIVIAILAILAYGFVCARENRMRDSLQASNTERSEQVEAEAFSDLTEKEKPAFRYVY